MAKACTYLCSKDSTRSQQQQLMPSVLFHWRLRWIRWKHPTDDSRIDHNSPFRTVTCVS